MNSSPNKIDAENKRKHDEIQSDFDSDEDNLLTMNLDGYRSDDDPNYEVEVQVLPYGYLVIELR